MVESDRRPAVSPQPEVRAASGESSSVLLSVRSKLFLLLTIWALYAIHSMDRSIFFLILPALQTEFHLSNQQTGILSGIAYALPAALFGIPFGILGDRKDRKLILIVLVIGWSLVTGLSGLAASFLVLLGLRALVGALESGAPPIMLSVLADAFSPRRRPLAFSIYYTGANLGVILSGWLTYEIGQRMSWRGLMMIAALPGLALALVLFLLVKFPGRQRAPQPAAIPKPPGAGQFARLARQPGFAVIYVACVLAGMNAMAIGPWISVFLVRGHGASLAQAGSIVALAQGLGGAVGGLIGGSIANRFADGRASRLCVIAGSGVAMSIPFGIAAGLAGNIHLASFALAGWAVCAMMFMAPAYSAVLSRIPSEMRGTAAAFVIVGSQIVGAGLGPQVVAALADALSGFGPQASIRYAIATMSALACIPAGLFMVHAFKSR